MMRTIRTIALIGTLLFATLLIALITMPKTYERNALGFAKSEVTRAVQERFEGSTAAQGLAKLSGRLGLQQDSLKTLQQGDFPEIVGAVIANYCNCAPATDAQTDAATQAVRAAISARISALGIAETRVTEMIKGRYDSTIEGLRRDLLIFLGTNLAAFMLIGLASFARTTRRTLIIYPAALLALTVVICCAFYVFNTDWFYTLLFQNFTGFGYTVWMAVLFALLIDITLNYARVTLKILSNLPSALVPPC